MILSGEPIKGFEPLWGNWYADELLGEGGYGRVYRLVRRDGGGTYYSACKHITIPKNEAEVQSARAMGMDKQSTYTYFSDMASRILNEINIMYALRGESNIVTYEDHIILHQEGALKWDVFIRMELLVPLSAYITDNPMEPEEIRRLGVEICSALEACEAYKIIHRDIKEGNIFLNPRGTFKLGDFGIAREMMAGNMSMSMRGTPSYVAPEVYNGRPYDATVDLYSLGILMYKLLNNNRYPFFPPAPQMVTVESSEQAFAMRMQGATPAWPANGDDALRSAVMKVISFDPRRRFQSASEMKAALLGRAIVAAAQPVYAASGTPHTPRPQPAPNAAANASQGFAPNAGYIPPQQPVPGYAYAPPRPQSAPAAASPVYSPAQQNAVPSPAYAPAQQNAVPPPAYVPPQQGTAAYGKQKKGGAGIILGVIGGAVLLIALIVVLLSGSGFGAADKYKKALAYEVMGSYEEALELFLDIPKYEDSAEHIGALRYKLVDEYLKAGTPSLAAAMLDSTTLGDAPSAEQSAELQFYRIKVDFAEGNYDAAFSGVTSLYSSQANFEAYEQKLMDFAASWITEHASTEQAAALQTQFADNRTALKLINHSVYAKASALLEAENTADAKTLFDALGPYDNAADMSKECVYRDAEKAFGDGRFDEAQALFKSISSYSDAADKADLSLYRYACARFTSGDYAGAFGDFSALLDTDFVPDDTFFDDYDWQIYDVAKAYYASGDYENAITGFILSGSYERSYDYFTLSLIHQYGVTASDKDSLVALIGFEDAAALLLSTFDIAWEFLLGEWSCSAGTLEFKSKSDSNHLTYSLSAPDFGDSWGIENGLLYFFDSDSPSDTRNVYLFTVVSKNEMSCYAYKNGNTYTLKRK